MDEYLSTGKASPRSERAEVQCSYEVVGGIQAGTDTKNRVLLKRILLVPTDSCYYINSISTRLFWKHLDIKIPTRRRNDITYEI